MPAKDNYRAEMDLVNAHGVFAVDPNHLTTPIRMAAFGWGRSKEDARWHALSERQRFQHYKGARK